MWGAVMVAIWVIFWHFALVYGAIWMDEQGMLFVVPLSFVFIGSVIMLFGSSLILEIFEGIGIYPMNGMLSAL